MGNIKRKNSMRTISYALNFWNYTGKCLIIQYKHLIYSPKKKQGLSSINLFREINYNSMHEFYKTIQLMHEMVINRDFYSNDKRNNLHYENIESTKF